jgi:hypothetical protein
MDFKTVKGLRFVILKKSVLYEAEIHVLYTESDLWSHKLYRVTVKYLNGFQDV